MVSITFVALVLPMIALAIGELESAKTFGSMRHTPNNFEPGKPREQDLRFGKGVSFLAEFCNI